MRVLSADCVVFSPPPPCHDYAFFLHLTRRALARAELAGNSVEDVFSSLDESGKDSLSHAQFWEVTLAVNILYSMSSNSLKLVLSSPPRCDPITA